MTFEEWMDWIMPKWKLCPSIRREIWRKLWNDGEERCLFCGKLYKNVQDKGVSDG